MIDRKDELIQALQEMVNELTIKLINLRVEAGMKLKEKDAEMEKLSHDEHPPRQPDHHSTNGSTEWRADLT